MFILHAEHEMNCSTAAARHLASSGVDVYTAMSGAVGALYGPLHGGANEAVLRMLQRIGKVRRQHQYPLYLARNAAHPLRDIHHYCITPQGPARRIQIYDVEVVAHCRLRTFPRS